MEDTTDQGWERDWERIDRAISEASEARDRTIIALSSSALAVSIGFFHAVFADDPANIPAIGGAWALFTTSAVAALLSMESAEWSLRWAQRRLRGGSILDSEAPAGWRARVTWGLNRLAVWSLVSGLGLFLWFVLNNVRGG